MFVMPIAGDSEKRCYHLLYGHGSLSKMKIRRRYAAVSFQVFSVQRSVIPCSVWNGGRTHNTKTDIEVTEVGNEPVPDRGARKVWIIVPGAAAQHTTFVAF